MDSNRTEAPEVARDEVFPATFPLVELTGGPRTFHVLLHEASDGRTEWVDVEVIGIGSRWPIVLALTDSPNFPIGTVAEIAFGQLHSDESARWQKHLQE